MPRFVRRTRGLLTFLILFLAYSWNQTNAIASSTAVAGDQIEVKNAWARPTIGSGRISAAYFQLRNSTKEVLSLTGIELAIGNAEIHESLIENGVMRMRSRDEINIAPGESVDFVPGGLHVMLMNLKQPLELEKTFTMILKTKDDRTIPVTVKILKP